MNVRQRAPLDAVRHMLGLQKKVQKTPRIVNERLKRLDLSSLM